MGIDKNQFTQIAMLAQGDFMKLLLSSTEDRKKIFRQLFHTGKFDRVQDALKQGARDAREEYDAVKNELNFNISEVSCPEESPYYETLSRFTREWLDVSEIINLIKKISDSDAEALKSYENDERKIDSNIADIIDI